MLLAWSAAVSASAQVEVCAGVLALPEWREAMDAVDEALIALDGARADRILDDLLYEMRCLHAPVPPAELGRLARQVALVAFFAQDQDELGYWGQLALQAAGGAPWPEAVTIPDRFFEMLDALPEPEPTRAEGGLAIPRGGGALLDGVLLTEPIATEGVQHLLQIADKGGRVVSTAWQTGASFDRTWLEDDPRPEGTPGWYVAPPPPPPLRDAPVPEPVPEVPQPEVPQPEAPRPAPTVRFDGDGATQECPWRGPPRNVSAKGREVRVNRHTFPVRTAEDQDAFRQVLRACGEFRAARRFVRWRVARRKLFRSGSQLRDAMIEALVTPEPPRKPRHP